MTRPRTRPAQQTLGLAEALNRGIAFLRQGKLSDAEQLFLKIIEVRPAHPDARHFLGVLRFRQGRADEALDLLNGVLHTHPNSPFVLSNLAFVLHALGRFREALECFDKALALEPDHPEALCNRGNTLKELGRQDEALESYERAIAARPGYAEALNGRASVLMEQGKWGEVESCLRESASRDPNRADTQISLGLLLLQLGRKVEAVAQARIAARLEAQSTFPHYTFGVLLARCGLAQEAQKHLRTSLLQDPQDRQGARLLLAGLGCEPLPDRASEALVNRLYDKRALMWDRMMVDGQYNGARLVADALKGLAGPGAKLDILDAGCGTGLVGVLVHECARSLEGVDSSGDMLARASEKGVYTTLHKADLAEFLLGHPGSYDAVTCAATLIHFGDLRPPLTAARSALRRGGWLIFTLFSSDHDKESYSAGTLDGFAQAGCYAHGRAYVRSIALSLGFEVAMLEEAVHEHHYGTAKMGLLAALRRPDD